MKPAKVRANAALILASLLKQQGSLASLLPRPADIPEADQNQSALLRELCFGTCRWYHRLDAILATLIQKPLRNKDTDIRCLLLLGLYQLEYMRLADHAAVNETVNATALLKKGWAKSLVNGVLRQYQRQLAEQGGALQDAAAPDPIHHSYPSWLVERLQTDWPEQWQEVLQAGNQHPPMTLRVNGARLTRRDYVEQLQVDGIDASAGKFAPGSVYLSQGRPVASLPGFYDGLVSVQDEASQLIPGLLDVAAGHRVLDACAAPGGKTCHILETEPGLHSLLALDIEDRRLARVRENFSRLSLDASIVQLRAADSSDPQSWWDSVPFDRILLDAPCSATGIIRRQPDIKVLRQPVDVEKLILLQQALLQALWNCLAPGGILLYSTCSILRSENEQQVLRFLEHTPDATELPIDAPWGISMAAGRQLLPSDHGPDGFYFARLRKNAA